MGNDAGGQFAFLKQAKAANLYKLLAKLGRDDAAMALAHLPPLLSAQVMAYFPEDSQSGLMAAMREARRAAPEAAVATVKRITDLLAAAKEAGGAAPAGQAREQPEKSPAPTNAMPPERPRPVTPGRAVASAYGGKPSRPHQDKPQPWRPRVTDETPINAPAKPNQPPAVAGDPASSPLAKLNLSELFGMAKKTLLGKQSAAPKTTDAQPRAKSSSPLKTGASGKPEPVEGVVSGAGVRTSSTPRVLGVGGQSPRKKGAVPPLRRPPPKAPTKTPAASTPPKGQGRKIDGMAVLAAILREAPMDVRQNVAADSPALFKALKERMFVFDDLHFSDAEALAQVFTIAPIPDAALALRFATPALRDRALRAISPRRADLILAETGGPAGLDAIEAAQKRVLDVALRLQSAGRIIIDPRDPDLAI